MKVFKFGGASVKDAEAVRNVTRLLEDRPADKIFVVVSAMGKTTNALEAFARALFEKNKEAPLLLGKIKEFHFNILSSLFNDVKHPVFELIHNTFIELDWKTEEDPGNDFDFLYDQVVSVGELLSSRIISSYLNYSGLVNSWIDIRDILRTDNHYREGNIDYEQSQSLFDRWMMREDIKNQRLFVSQGFIAGTAENYTTTLGREGSDYSASLVAYLSNASSVTIWKDVPGVLSADPRIFEHPVLLSHLSYHDAVELTYYGASVIHPKTIKPLQNKQIPLYVRSFMRPDQPGTVIDMHQDNLHLPCFIYKPSQILISVRDFDFSFMIEKNVSHIFELLSKHHVKVNMMQHGAVSLSLCIDDDHKAGGFIAELRKNFQILYNSHMHLYTIRYYTEAAISQVTAGKQVLLEQRSRHTYQVIRNEGPGISHK